MKKLLKMSLLGLVMSIALTSCNGCGNTDKKNPETPIDSTKVDTTKADASRVKDDTTKMDKADTTVKKQSVKK